MVWSESDTLKLIKLYRQFECLWDYRQSSYKRLDVKNNAWRQISKAMNRDIWEVKKKIKNLRTAYLPEKKKVDASIKSGASAGSIYQPHLFYYRKMHFLDSVVVLRRRTSIINTDDAEHADEATELKNTLTENNSCTSFREERKHFVPSSPINAAPLHSPSSTLTSSSSGSRQFSQRKSRRNKKLKRAVDVAGGSFTSSSSGGRQFSKRKSKRDEKLNSAVDAVVACAKTVEADKVFFSFGKTIALQLRQLTLQEATLAMSDIHRYITRKVLANLNASKSDAVKKINEPDPLEAAMFNGDI